MWKNTERLCFGLCWRRPFVGIRATLECTPTHSHPSWNLLLDLRALMLQGSVILWPLVLTTWPLPMIQVKCVFSAWKGCSFILYVCRTHLVTRASSHSPAQCFLKQVTPRTRQGTLTIC